MPFDAFNVSLVEHCLDYDAGLELVTYSHIQGTRRAKSPKKCALVAMLPYMLHGTQSVTLRLVSSRIIRLIKWTKNRLHGIKRPTQPTRFTTE
jgi:hypothetical protein